MEMLRAAAEQVVRSWLAMTSRLPTWRTAESSPAQRGQGLAEYALILGGIAVVAIVSLVFLGGTISELFWDPISDDFGDVLCNVIGIC